ncbi:hypothetical protein ERJ75_000333400 [Trypanosoma vivax]|nr:hypothetical protein ERJ75_000333800 [Trypanosoma vivax]KAH8617931.1 hypothetical protein ERJ75_000333200 [Trypanosoma vivax]KAH8617983.1 hypothetical protein ERJ75_000333400 [Trypanosoma vivax]
MTVPRKLVLECDKNSQTCVPNAYEIKPWKFGNAAEVPSQIVVEHRKQNHDAVSMHHVVSHFLGEKFLDEKPSEDSGETIGSLLSKTKSAHGDSIMDALRHCFASHMSFTVGGKEYNIPMFRPGDGPNQVNVCTFVAVRKYIEKLVEDAGVKLPSLGDAFLNAVKDCQERGLITEDVVSGVVKFTETGVLPPAPEVAKACGVPNVPSGEASAGSKAVNVTLTVEAVFFTGHRVKTTCNCSRG